MGVWRRVRTDTAIPRGREAGVTMLAARGTRYQTDALVCDHDDTVGLCRSWPKRFALKWTCRFPRNDDSNAHQRANTHAAGVT